MYGYLKFLVISMEIYNILGEYQQKQGTLLLFVIYIVIIVDRNGFILPTTHADAIWRQRF